MSCKKTGAVIYLEPYQEYALCDAFEIEPILERDADIWRTLSQQGLADKIKNIGYFNIVSRNRENIYGRGEPHYTIHNWDYFNQATNGFLISNDYTRN